MTQTTHPSQLKRCPWCNDDGADWESPIPTIWYGRCNNQECGALGPNRRTKEEATSAWNTRHDK